MAKVFISYSRRDLSFVERMVQDLEGAGVSVWYDLSGMEGMDGMDPGADPASQEQQKPESTGKKLLKGLLRNL